MAVASGDQPAEDVQWSRSLLDRLPSLIGYWDREQRNVFANDAYIEYWGTPPEQVAGRHMRDVLGEDIYKLNVSYIRAALAGREQSFSRTLIDSKGATRHAQVTYIPNSVNGRIDGFYAVVTDVTARVEAEQTGAEALRRFEAMVANAPFGKAMLDTNGVLLHVNPALCTALGHPAEHVVGENYRRLVHPDDICESEADFELLVSGAQTKVSAERRYMRVDGSFVWMLCTAVLVRGAGGAEDMVVAQYDDITTRRHTAAELARMAITDPLTGLHNRRAFDDWISRQRGSHPTGSIGIIYVDLDEFKIINDTHGHATGDAILAEAARSLSRVVDAPSTTYRLGGDEFIVLVPDPDASNLAELAETITRALTGRYGDSVQVSLTASVGWTHGPMNDFDELLRGADAKMYHRKSLRTQHRQSIP